MVMNRAHGDREGLPFDLKHRRGPIYYDLADHAGGATRRAAEDAIVPALKEAIRLRLDNLSAAPTEDDRAAIVARVTQFHDERVAQITASAAPVGLPDGPRLVMHVVPFSATDGRPAGSLDAICNSPGRFPPIADDRPRDWRVGYDGLLTGSNGDGLRAPQRAYVLVAQSGSVEAVAAGRLLTVGGGVAIEFPKLRSMISTYAARYVESLSLFGLARPSPSW
jgi:hypothetical protein